MVYEGSSKLGDFFKSRKEKGTSGLPTFSVTLTNGLVPRDSLDRKMETNIGDEEHLLARKGDIAYNMMRMWQGASGLAKADGLLSPAYVVLMPKKGIDSLFASYLFKSPRLIYLFWAYSYGLTHDRLRLYYNDFKNIPLTVPSVQEQQKIAQILSTWDRVIEKLEALIAAKQKRKKALMQQLLTGKKRFAGFDTDWKKCKLADIGTFTKGNGITKDDLIENGLPCIRYGEIYTTHHNYIRKFISFIPQEIAKNSTKLQKGDLLFAGSGETSEEIGKCVAYLNNQEAYAGGDIIIFRPFNDDSKYLGYLMNDDTMAYQKARVGQGHSVVHISAKNLSRLHLSLPSIEEQQKIASVLSAADTEIETHQKQLTALRSCLEKRI